MTSTLLIVSAVYLFFMGIVFKVENFRSAFVFKMLPAALGTGLFILFLMDLGFVIQMSAK